MSMTCHVLNNSEGKMGKERREWEGEPLINQTEEDVDSIYDTATEGTSTIGTFLIFLKSYLGSGIMAMAVLFLSPLSLPLSLLFFFLIVFSHSPYSPPLLSCADGPCSRPISQEVCS
jgi:hypothetical protein